MCFPLRENGREHTPAIRTSTRGSLLYPSKLKILLFEGAEIAVGYPALSDQFPCVGEDGFEVFGCGFETGQEAVGGFSFWLHTSRIGKRVNCDAIAGMAHVSEIRRLAESV